MTPLAFLADVHISPQTVAELRERNYDIIRSTERLPATATDAEILELARTEQRIIITQDLDFSMLIALGKYSQPSVITLRLSSIRPSEVSQKLLETLPRVERELQEGVAIKVSQDTARIRTLPI